MTEVRLTLLHLDYTYSILKPLCAVLYVIVTISLKWF